MTMNKDLLKDLHKPQLKTDLPVLSVGDTVDVHCRIIEGAKERIQVFNGVLIAIHGGGLEQMIVVRRIVANEGVERTFPTHSPRIAKIEVVRHGDVRRSKLYYLRDRVGKKRRLRDRRRGLGEATVAEPETAATPAAAAPKAAAPEPAGGKA
jgi:large subunit ribosomal protein L19